MKKTKRKEVIKKAIKDFYNKSTLNAFKLLKYILKHNKPILTEQEKSDVWHIKTNLSDKTYRKGLEMGDRTIEIKS